MSISVETISDAVAALYSHINVELRPDVVAALERARASEESPVARGVLDTLLENVRISERTHVPLCQDTGMAVAFVQLGVEVVVTGGTLQGAIDDGVRRAAAEHPLRKSSVSTPLGRANTGDNAPAIVHIEQVPGDALTISMMAKGGGAENMSRIFMLAPAQGRDGIIESIVETVRLAGANPCPPVIIGVGIGGNFERAPLLAKRALLRSLDTPNPDAELAALEAEVLTRINALGIGPQGLGGRTTALGVLIEQAPCHIASLPLAVNVECHSHRHGVVRLTSSS